MFVVV